MTEQVYEDDEKLRSILDVLKAVRLFGEVIAIRNLASEDEVDTEDTEEDDWVDIQSKYGHDTTEYTFTDRSEIRAGSITLDIDTPSGHDWIASVTKTGRMAYVAVGTKATCGHLEADCFDIDCHHIPIIELQEEIRHEFKEDWNSMADRPTENFFLGLPGLKYVEIDQTFFTRINSICNNCYLYTPTRLETCQNCDRVLVAA